MPVNDDSDQKCTGVIKGTGNGTYFVECKMKWDYYPNVRSRQTYLFLGIKTDDHHVGRTGFGRGGCRPPGRGCSGQGKAEHARPGCSLCPQLDMWLLFRRHVGELGDRDGIEVTMPRKERHKKILDQRTLEAHYLGRQPI